MVGWLVVRKLGFALHHQSHEMTMKHGDAMIEMLILSSRVATTDLTFGMVSGEET